MAAGGIEAERIVALGTGVTAGRPQPQRGSTVAARWTPKSERRPVQGLAVLPTVGRGATPLAYGTQPETA